MTEAAAITVSKRLLFEIFPTITLQGNRNIKNHQHKIL